MEGGVYANSSLFLLSPLQFSRLAVMRIDLRVNGTGCLRQLGTYVNPIGDWLLFSAGQWVSQRSVLS